ncbi:hypothetical protein P7C73_g1003, partial [Tremellales sp. Uapishka_1]
MPLSIADILQRTVVLTSVGACVYGGVLVAQGHTVRKARTAALLEKAEAVSRLRTTSDTGLMGVTGETTAGTSGRINSEPRGDAVMIGIYGVSVDSGTTSYYSGYATPGSYQAALYATSGLDQGDHELKLSNENARNVASYPTYTYVDFDYVALTGTLRNANSESASASAATSTSATAVVPTSAAGSSSLVSSSSTVTKSSSAAASSTSMLTSSTSMVSSASATSDTGLSSTITSTAFLSIASVATYNPSGASVSVTTTEGLSSQASLQTAGSPRLSAATTSSTQQSSDDNSPSSQHKTTTIAISVTVIVIAAVIIATIGGIWWWKRRKSKRDEEDRALGGKARWEGTVALGFGSGYD